MFHFRSILSDIFLNDLLTTLENLQIYNFADGNTISSSFSFFFLKKALPATLEKESEKAVDWSRRNNVIILKNFRQCFYKGLEIQMRTQLNLMAMK